MLMMWFVTHGQTHRYIGAYYAINKASKSMGKKGKLPCYIKGNKPDPFLTLHRKLTLDKLKI